MGIITNNRFTNTRYKSKAKERREMMKRYPLSYFMYESDIRFSVKENSHNIPYQPIRAVINLSAKNSDCALFENLMDQLTATVQINDETRMCVLSKEVAREFTTTKFYTPIKARVIELFVRSFNQFRLYVEVDPSDCMVPDALMFFVDGFKKI